MVQLTGFYRPCESKRFYRTHPPRRVVRLASCDQLEWEEQADLGDGRRRTSSSVLALRSSSRSPFGALTFRLPHSLAWQRFGLDSLPDETTTSEQIILSPRLAANLRGSQPSPLIHSSCTYSTASNEAQLARA